MPILQPITPLSIQQVLRPARDLTKSQSLRDKMNASGLSEEEIFDTIRSVMAGADTSAARLSAAKTAAELHGLLESDSVKPIPVVNITIVGSNNSAINPIFLPREIDTALILEQEEVFDNE